MAFDALTGSMTATFAAQATKNAVSSGLNFSATTNTQTVSAKVSIVTGGNIANGANEFILSLLTCAASGSTTVDLTALTDVIGASANLARYKGYLFWLLGLAEDSVNGTACSSIAVGNAGSNANLMGLGGTTPTMTLNNGDVRMLASRQAAGIVVDSTHKNILFTNNDSGNSMAALFLMFGSTT